ncbi:MAG: DUF92 domain-containing protein [Nitrososphaerota archaeon]|nr:DUF92 domain-containing protein [Nitrososphaerota archaeon]
MGLTLIVATVDFFVVIAFALAAILLKAIDGRGFIASVAVGCSILLGGGWDWFIVVAVFFTLGVAFTWYKYGYKKKLGGAQEKGGARNWPNILANGGISSLAAIIYFFQPSTLVAALFLGSMSTAAADTVATELGLLSKKKPRLITDLSKEVAPGTSGGVSLLGFVGALVASGVIGTMAILLGIMHAPILLLTVSVVGGLFGAIFDSLLGAAVQRKGYCAVCKRPTESLTHCGEMTTRTSGVPFIENNMVNLLATLAGGAVAGLVALL